MKTLNLTFRMPTPVPLETECKHAFNLWFRMHKNYLARLYSSYKGPDEFIEFGESMCTEDCSI